jgi:hypothetical protein
MTECNQSSFGFEACGKREIVARFDGGTISSDGGALLLRQTDERLNLLPRLAGCFLDGRNQKQVEHSILEMLSQRIYGLALGYEDVNDHEELRKDPVFGILAGRENSEEPLAGKSTLNRMELGSGTPDRYKKITFWKEALDELLVKIFLESHQQAPEQIILDVDTTCRYMASRRGGSSMATTIAIAICRCTSSVASMCCARVCEKPTTTQRSAAGRKSKGL